MEHKDINVDMVLDLLASLFLLFLECNLPLNLYLADNGLNHPIKSPFFKKKKKLLPQFLTFLILQIKSFGSYFLIISCLLSMSSAMVIDCPMMIRSSFWRVFFHTILISNQRSLINLTISW